MRNRIYKKCHFKYISDRIRNKDGNEIQSTNVEFNLFDHSTCQCINPLSMPDFLIYLLNLTLTFFVFAYIKSPPFYKTQLLFIECRLELHIARKNRDATSRPQGSLRRCTFYERRNTMTAGDRADEINYDH